jgi:hypothetical protein
MVDMATSNLPTPGIISLEARSISIGSLTIIDEPDLSAITRSIEAKFPEPKSTIPIKKRPSAESSISYKNFQERFHSRQVVQRLV